MNKIQAALGEMVYTFLERAIQEVKNSNYNAIVARHNDISIIVHKESCIEDICDKFDMQVKINRLQQGA